MIILYYYNILQQYCVYPSFWAWIHVTLLFRKLGQDTRMYCVEYTLVYQYIGAYLKRSNITSKVTSYFTNTILYDKKNIYISKFSNRARIQKLQFFLTRFLSKLSNFSKWIIHFQREVILLYYYIYYIGIVKL